MTKLVPTARYAVSVQDECEQPTVSLGERTCATTVSWWAATSASISSAFGSFALEPSFCLMLSASSFFFKSCTVISKGIWSETTSGENGT